jgi:hypothetical protein
LCLDRIIFFDSGRIASGLNHLRCESSSANGGRSGLTRRQRFKFIGRSRIFGFGLHSRHRIRPKFIANFPIFKD